VAAVVTGIFVNNPEGETIVNPLNFKLVSITPPAAISDNATLTTAEIDTQGWAHLEVIVYLGATDIAMAALSVTQSDTSGSGHESITGLVWGTSTNIDGSTSALPSATDDNLFQVAQIDLRGKKRFIDVTATTGDGAAGSFVTILGRLTCPQVSPASSSEAGANEILRA
jgi:hypothetical protein